MIKIKAIVFVFIGLLCLTLGALYQKNNLSLATSPSIYNEILTDIEGNEVRLNRFKGQLLILNFWATWCEPCREEIPELNQFSLSHKDAVLIGIAVDDLDSVKKFQKGTPIKYLSLIANMEGVRISQSLGNDKGVLPFTVVIDPSGETIKSFYGKVKITELNQAVTHK